MMKPKRLKVYARSGLISTKLPIVKDLIEIITHIQMYQNDMKMVLDRYTAIQEGFGVKPRHMQSSRSRGLGRRIHGSVEDTKLSTNKQHSLLSAPRSLRKLGEAFQLSALLHDSFMIRMIANEVLGGGSLLEEWNRQGS